LNAGALLNAGADVNRTNGRGETPLLSLLYAPAQFFPPAGLGNERRVQIAHLLLEKGQCHVNHPTKMGKTALSVACELHRHELVPLLMEYGATIPPNAIFDCLSHPKLDTMAFLLEHDSDIVNEVDGKGSTVLHYAAANGRVDLVQLLLHHQADVSMVDGIRNSTALMAAILQSLYYYQNATTTTTNHCNHHHQGHYLARAEEDQVLIVHLLLEQMARMDPRLIDHQDFEGYTALHLAAQVGSPLIIKEILDWKPNLTLRNCPERNTALHSTLLSPSSPGGVLQLAEKLKCLLEHVNGYSNANNDSSLQNEYGYTVLHSIVACSHLHPLIEYVSSVMDVRIPDDVNGDTALHMAAKTGLSNKDHYFDLLLRGRHDGRVVEEAANVRNHQGRTALMEAILSGNTDAVMALMPVTDLDMADVVEGKTALHYAIQKQDSMYVDLLLCRDANTWMIRDHQGNTAFALACCLGDDDGNDEIPLQLSIIFQLYRYGVAYGEQSNMI